MNWLYLRILTIKLNSLSWLNLIGVASLSFWLSSLQTNFSSISETFEKLKNLKKELCWNYLYSTYDWLYLKILSIKLNSLNWLSLIGVASQSFSLSSLQTNFSSVSKTVQKLKNLKKELCWNILKTTQLAVVSVNLNIWLSYSASLDWDSAPTSFWLPPIQTNFSVKSPSSPKLNNIKQELCWSNSHSPKKLVELMNLNIIWGDWASSKLDEDLSFRLLLKRTIYVPHFKYLLFEFTRYHYTSRVFLVIIKTQVVICNPVNDGIVKLSHGLLTSWKISLINDSLSCARVDLKMSMAIWV